MDEAILLECNVTLWFKVNPLVNEKKYRFLEHSADAYVEAWGRDLAEAFENAAVAMFDVMTEVEKIALRREDSVSVEGEDEYSLLYNWLEALLIKSETEGMLYSKFKVSPIKESGKLLKLEAKIWGEKFAPNKHLQKVGVKAVTYHRMEVLEQHEKAMLRFILDI
jgi:SHS2 domain-containing protein